MTAKPQWLPDVAAHDYEAARNYLTLRLDEHRADVAIAALRASGHVEQRRANDIIRACGLPALPREDPGVAKNLAKIKAGKKLSPVLLVSYGYGGDIADGYHRVSAAYLLDPYGLVPLRIGHVPGLRSG